MLDLPPLLAHLVELATLALVNGIAVGVGLRLLWLLGASLLLSLGERLVFGLALGYGALGFLMLALGLLGLIYGPVALGLLVALGVIASAPLLAAWREAVPVLRRGARGLRYPPNLFLALVILVTAGVALVKALVPVATQDDLMYHLALPRRYVEAHAIAFYPDSTYSLFPQLMEMLYTWGLLLGSDRLSVLFAFSAALLGPVAAALFAKRHLGDSGAGVWRTLPLLVAAIFFSIPLVGFVLRAANTDLAQASFDLPAVYAFYLAVGRQDAAPRYRLLALSGLCCGLSFSVKYYGFAMGLALGVALLALTLFRRRSSSSTEGKGHQRVSIASLAAFALPLIALVAPWLTRNYFAAGNPVWPLAGSFFGGSYWSTVASPETLLGRAPGFSLANLWTGLEYLWVATTRGPSPIDMQRHVVNLGPLLLGALLLLPVARWQPALRWVAYAAGSYWLLWAFFFSRTSARYLSTFFLLAALLGAYALVSVAARRRPLQWMAGGIVAVAFSFLAVQAALSAGPYLSTAFALDKNVERQYLQAYMEDYRMVQYIADNLPPNATVYVWDGQPRGYYIARPYVYARLVPLYTGFGGEPDRWRARLAELGITHVLVHNRDILAPGQPLGSDPALEVGRHFATLYFTPPLFRVGNFTLYALR